MKDVFFDSKGESGNIFAVMTLAYNKLKKSDGDEMIKRTITSKDYDEALSVIREYVNLIDVSDDY